MVGISVWRNNNDSKVWYEWAMSIYEPDGVTKVAGSSIHNINGRGFAIGQ